MEASKVITYSLLAQIRNSGNFVNSSVEIFVPIVKYALYKLITQSGVYKGASITEISTWICQYFGLDFPPAVLEKILLKIGQEINTSEELKLQVYRDGSFWIKNYSFEEFNDIYETNRQQVELVQTMFKQFCDINDVKKDSYNTIFDFVNLNKLKISNYLANRDYSVNGSKFSIEAQFVEYFRNIPGCYEVIRKIYLGSILSCYLSEYEPQDKMMSDVELLLDTNFIVSLLDLNTPESTTTCRQLYLLAELNYKRFMFKKLCILLIFSKLKVNKLLIDKYRMHNLYAIFAKLLNICKQIAGNLVNESGNVPRRGFVPKFSDLEVVALNMASEAVGIDSESLLFANLQEYRVEIPNLISRRQYNDRRKITSSLCNAIRERMVAEMDGGEDYFCIDSKPIEVCRIARSKRCSMGKKDFSKAPGVGYCASQSMYYYGYKLHAVCGLSGVIHSFDLTKASVHDIHYLKDVKVDYSNCTVIGDRGYISAQVQLDLFETANIRLEVPYRCNQKEWKPTFPAFAKARKRIETLFSQLCDQFMIIRNYAKDTDGLFARIIGKISALTILQYINYKNEKPIGRVKYALF